jgi:transposase
MAHGRARDPRKEQHWRRFIELWRHSGMSVRAFCDRHHLAEPSFYAWRRHFQQRAAATPTLVPVQIIPDDPPRGHCGIEVVLADGRCLRVAPGFDPATLRQVLAVLEEAPPC